VNRAGDTHHLTFLALFGWTLVLLEHVNTLNEDAVRFWKNLKHLTALAVVLTSYNGDRVTFFD
jgi:hypothetical protein